MHAGLVAVRRNRHVGRPVERVVARRAVRRASRGGPGVEREERGEVEREEGDEDVGGAGDLGFPVCG